MFGLGATELLVILAVALLVFGPRRLPEIGGALGKSIRDFRKSFQGQEEDPGTTPAEPPKDERQGD